MRKGLVYVVCAVLLLGGAGLACNDSSNPTSTAALALSIETQIETTGNVIAGGFDIVFSARVLREGGAAPDGTIVTFETDRGTFANGQASARVATVGGVAEATLSLVRGSTAHVTITVEDLLREVTVVATESGVSISG